MLCGDFPLAVTENILSNFSSQVNTLTVTRIVVFLRNFVICLSLWEAVRLSHCNAVARLRDKVTKELSKIHSDAVSMLTENATTLHSAGSVSIPMVA